MTLYSFLSAALAIALALSIIPVSRDFIPLSVRGVSGFVFALAINPEHVPSTIGDIAQVALGVFALACPIAFATESLAMAGRMIDISRGAQASEQILGESSRGSLLENSGRVLALLWFYLVDIEFFLRSLRLTVFCSVLDRQYVNDCLALFAQSFATGFYLAAPCMILALLLDGSGMVLARFLPKLPISFELLPIRLLAILFLLALRLHGESDSLALLHTNTIELITPEAVEAS